MHSCTSTHWCTYGFVLDIVSSANLSCISVRCVLSLHLLITHSRDISARQLTPLTQLTSPRSAHSPHITQLTHLIIIRQKLTHPQNLLIQSHVQQEVWWPPHPATWCIIISQCSMHAMSLHVCISICQCGGEPHHPASCIAGGMRTSSSSHTMYIIFLQPHV